MKRSNLMKKWKTNTVSFLTVILVLGLVSCKEDNSTNPDDNTKDTGITMSFKTTGDDETEYLITKDSIMSDTISAVGKGIEQTGWRYYFPVGNTLFASGYQEQNRCLAYTKNEDGEIVLSGEFVFDTGLEMFGASNDNSTMVAVDIPRESFDPKVFTFVDVAGVSVEKKVQTNIFNSVEDSLIAWPASIQIRGDKMFVPFHKVDAMGDFTTPSVDTAFVAVYSYPDMGSEPEKIITDTRTCYIGVNGSTSGMIETDNGDIYSYSCGAKMAGFNPVSSKPSGILRINAAGSEFDPNYFFNIEQATGGGKIFWFEHLTGNKALARILTDDNGEVWGAFGRENFNQKLVILDLANKTVTDVKNVPLHAKRYTSPLYVEDGKVYVSIETASDAYVYRVDIETATAVKGAKIEGKTIKGFYKL